MKDDVWTRDEIESPCVKICVIHPDTRLCTGCKRSMDEIARWSQMTADERKSITADLPDRAAVLKTRRGGRAGRLSRGRGGLQ